MNIQRKDCGNCEHQSGLIMWERDKDGNYRPNYDNELNCCTAMVGMSDGNIVYGNTEPHNNGICEMWVRRKVE